MEEKILGFEKQEIVVLYHYLCVYEKKLKSLDSNKKLFKEYPAIERIESLLDALNCKEYNSDSREITDKGFGSYYVAMTWSRSSKLTSFLHHLRNAIGHGRIEQQEDYIELKDYDTPKMKNITAQGRIKPSVLFEIINFINNKVII